MSGYPLYGFLGCLFRGQWKGKVECGRRKAIEMDTRTLGTFDSDSDLISISISISTGLKISLYYCIFFFFLLFSRGLGVDIF